MPKADLTQIALMQVGTWCYVWGGNGEDMTAMSATERESWICRRESDTQNRERVRKLFARLVENGVETIRGGDCSGFVYWCAKQLSVWKSDATADSMYRKTTRTDVPEAGDLAFRLNDAGKATHVGIYVGDGNFVHSKGRDDGVVCEKSKASYWQAYGIIKEFKPEPVPPAPDPPEPDPPEDPYVYVVGKSVNVRRQPTTTSKAIKIAHKGNRLDYVETEPYFDAKGGRWFCVSVPKKGDGWIRELSSKTGHRLCELRGAESEEEADG